MERRHLPRSLEALVEEQARRWELARSHWRGPAPRRPVITISRQHGAGGGALARLLAGELRLEVYDHELLHRVAEDAQLAERVVATLDDRDRNAIGDWLGALFGPSRLSFSGYRRHLTRVVATIAHHGGAVIVGRGGHLIVDPRQALRVFVVAPHERRVAEIARREGVGLHEARRRIAEVDGARAAFLRRLFHAEFGDAAAFDLVVNTAALGVDGAARAVRAALEGAATHAPAAAGA